MRCDVLLLAAIVVRSLRGGADAMRKEGHSTAPVPQNRSLRRGPEVLRKLWGNLMRMASSRSC
jgi:hypothetical protein